MRMWTGRALGYVPAGPVDFGLPRDRLAARTGESYGILFHATARPEKEWPEASWIALGRALAARDGSLLLPWGTQAERARSTRMAAALSNARAPERQPPDRVAAPLAGARFVIRGGPGLIHLAA